MLDIWGALGTHRFKADLFGSRLVSGARYQAPGRNTAGTTSQSEAVFYDTLTTLALQKHVFCDTFATPALGSHVFYDTFASPALVAKNHVNYDACPKFPKICVLTTPPIKTITF